MKQALSADIGENAGGEIRSEPCPRCYLCQTVGEMLYEGMRDRLFGAPGEWNSRRCPNPDCGLLWLDPMPIEADIGKAYESYFTHTDSGADTASAAEPQSPFYRSAATLARSAYVAHRYGYGDGMGKRFRWLLALPIILSRIDCDGLDIPLRYLAVSRKGRMLDVGCGGGGLLKLAQELGWDAEGVDFDSQAVDSVRRKGLTVHMGSLSDQHYPAESFDLVLMSHVIEHIHDAVGTLTEIHRVLKSAGTLVIITPNADSWGHRHFDSSWFALDPPRHLRIFNGQALASLANHAGFTRTSVASTLRSTLIVFVQSPWIRKSGRGDLLRPPKRSEALYARAATGAQQFMRIWKPLVAEELLLEARK
jgi:2-polyprenyl-3-methyl-5-hydroxy-6-metoxy-1,4-benzoquinol methylase